MSSSKKVPNRSELDQCLKDAGVVDDLSYTEKLDFYNAIRVSESITQEPTHTYDSRIVLDNICNENQKENEDPILHFTFKSIRRNQNAKCRAMPSTQSDKPQYSLPVNNNNTADEVLLEKEYSQPVKEREKTNDDEIQPSNSTQRKKYLKRKLQSPLVNPKRPANKSTNEYNAFDCPVSSKSSLKRLQIPLKYKMPYLYRKELNNLSHNDRVKAISEFHISNIQKYKLSQQNSFTFAKWGKPILPSYNFNGTLNKYSCLSSEAESEDDEPNLIKNQDTTTQKDTHENKEMICDDDTHNLTEKIVLEDDVVTNNRNNGKSSSSLEERVGNYSTYNLTQRDEDEVVINNNYNGTSSSPLETSKDVLIEEQANSSKLQVDDIDILKDDLEEVIFKSKRSYSGNKSRTDKMFDDYIEQERIKKNKEIEMEKFRQTLFLLSDDENDLTNESKSQIAPSSTIKFVDDIIVTKHTNVDSDTNVRIRYCPPNQMVKNKRGRDLRRKGTNNEEISKPKKRPKRGIKKIDEQKPQEQEISTSTLRRKNIQGDNNQKSSKFRSNLVDSDDVEEEQQSKMATCDLCNKEFLFNAEYEVHINNCIVEFMRE